MQFSDYRSFDAVGLGELVARREASPAELLEAALTRQAEVGPKVNAVTLPLEDFARREIAAGTPGEGPMAGVPFLLKDLGAQLAGTPTSSGSRVYKDQIAEADSAIVSAYRRAGLVIFGKTNTPEFGLAPVTEPALFGPTNNPWDLTRTPGGSSGGAAAAVAAGIVPAAHASDGGGSIRTPAACCGLFGLKPSRGRVSMSPAGEGWGGLSVQHAVANSVRDSAALLDIVCQPEPGDPYFLAPPDRPFLAEVGRDPGRLKIGFTTAALSAERLDPECAEAVLAAAKLCESLGHHLEEARVPDTAAAGEAGGRCAAVGTAAMLDMEGARRGRRVTADEVEPLTWAMYESGKASSGPGYVRAIWAVHAFGRAMADFHARYDILMLSTLGSPPIPTGYLTEKPDGREYTRRLFAFMPNTQMFNASGQPAMTVPLGQSRSGLPIGVQFVAPIGQEALLIRLAAQLEATQPWAGRRAPL